MLHTLKTQNIGPASPMDISFGPRLNIITGDNGLGKSFLLDIIWWVLTRKWPREVNPLLTQGYMARPKTSEPATVSFSVTSINGKKLNYDSQFSMTDQAWVGKAGRPYNAGLVLYAMPDGSFAVWDSARNYWKKKGSIDVQERQPAYVFSPQEVWDGLHGEGNSWLCNGLVRDVASWQKENGHNFNVFCKALESLSPSHDEILKTGPLTRIDLEDVRDMPALLMPYGDTVPMVYASSAVKRILSLTYLLIWSIEEHKRASELLGQAPSPHVTFLVDEVEAHLHPKWQRRILPALLQVVGNLMENSQIQMFAITHAALTLASLETLFDAEQDQWFDFDYADDHKSVLLVPRPFVRQGSAANWLTSDAFGLKTDFSLEKEDLQEKIFRMASSPTSSQADARALEQEMLRILPDIDPVWVRWRTFVRSKGWEV